jgi:hypothetical protein
METNLKESETADGSHFASSKIYSNDEEQPGVHTNKKRYVEEEVVIIDYVLKDRHGKV